MQLLRGAIRTYAWGSRTAIAEFTGRPVPAAHPEAELWLGANPGDPAWLENPDGEISLLQALLADPEWQLGPVVRARFGDALPFLLKVLAADEPLSLQAHPSAEQAAEGYLREERLGGHAAVGVLTHHLVMDGATEDFLSRLGEIVATHAAALWVDIRELAP